MSEIGALIIKLQAETSQFRADLGKVKSELNDLQGGAGETGRAFDASMGEAKGSLMLIEESVGVHLPRHLNTLIAKIPGVGEAFAVMLPAAGIAAAIMVIVGLIEKLDKLKEEAFQAGIAHTELGATIGKVMMNAENKFLEAGIKVDELRGKHLAALHKELELIDHQTLSDLVAQFNILVGAADKSFALLKAHWYELGHGSEGAKHSLEDFQAQYDLLNETATKDNGNKEKAQKLLDDKIKREEHILALQKEAREWESHSGEAGGSEEKANAYMQARIEMSQAGANYTEKDIKSQEELVDILHAQANAAKEIVAAGKLNKGAATDKANMAVAKDESALQKLVSEGTLAHAEAVHKLAKTQAEAALEAQKYNSASTIENKTEQEKAAVELERQAAVTAANDALAAKKAAYDADIKAAGVNAEKKKEIEQQYKNAVQTNDDAIKQANADAQKQITVIDAQAAQERRTRAIAQAQAEADGVLAIAIKGAKDKEKQAQEDAKNLATLHKLNFQQERDAQVQAVKNEISAEVQAYNDRIKALDKFDADYLKKVQELENKKKGVIKAGEDQEAEIIKQAKQKELEEIQAAENKMYDSIASNVAKDIVMNKSLIASFRQVGEEMAIGMIKNLILAELTHDKNKLIKAKDAATNSYDWASQWGGPIAGGVAAAAAFAAVMSFEVGGKIPGSGPVPIVGHGGETVVTKALTDRVERAENTGGKTSGDTHVHATFSPTIHAIDSDGVEGMLKQHMPVFVRQLRSEIRKLNR